MSKSITVAAVFALLAAAVLAVSASARSSAAPTNTVPPQVSGTPKVGQTLTVSNGTWSDSPTSYTYQWQRCSTAVTCANITGATAKTYKLVPADSGRTVRAVVTATNASGSTSANSNQTSVIAATGAPASTVKPAIIGYPAVGETLEAANGQWTGSPTSFKYQWLRCDDLGNFCFPIVGATGRTYGVRFSDVYSTLRVEITATNANGSSAARSEATDLVQPVKPVKVAGNHTPTLKFISLKRIGVRVYARFTVCDDSGRISVIERDAKRGTLAYVRKYSVTTRACITATRSWTPAPRFRTKGRFVVTLRAVDKSGASSKFVSRSLVRS